MQCPVCKTTYTDSSLRFCLADGTDLVPLEEATVIRRPGANALRVEIPTADTTPAFKPAPINTNKSGSPVIKIILGLAILGVVVIAAAAVIGVVIYFNMSGGASANQNQSTKSPTPQPTVVVSPTLDLEKQRLQDQLANVQRQLDEQKNTNRVSVPAFPTPPPTGQPGVVTARVNSPGDGFLAMRSEPSADYGDRVAKIPNGAVVSIQDCQREKIRIGDRTGRWCMVTYGDHVGWVFDAWLIY